MFSRKFVSHVCLISLTIFSLLFSQISLVFAQGEADVAAKGCKECFPPLRSADEKTENFSMAWHTSKENVDQFLKRIDGSPFPIQTVAPEEASKQLESATEVSDKTMNVDKLAGGLLKLKEYTTSEDGLRQTIRCFFFIDITIIDWEDGTVTIIVNYIFIGDCSGVTVLIDFGW